MSLRNKKIPSINLIRYITEIYPRRFWRFVSNGWFKGKTIAYIVKHFPSIPFDSFTVRLNHIANQVRLIPPNSFYPLVFEDYYFATCTYLVYFNNIFFIPVDYCPYALIHFALKQPTGILVAPITLEVIGHLNGDGNLQIAKPGWRYDENAKAFINPVNQPRCNPPFTHISITIDKIDYPINTFHAVNKAIDDINKPEEEDEDRDVESDIWGT